MGTLRIFEYSKLYSLHMAPSPEDSITLFFYICVYWFQPTLYHLGIPRSISRGVYSGLLHRCLQFIPFYFFFLKSTGQYLDGTLGVLPDLISLGIFLKCLEDMSEEACDADGVLCGTAEPEVGGGEIWEPMGGLLTINYIPA